MTGTLAEERAGLWPGAVFVAATLTAFLALNLLSSSAFTLPTDPPQTSQLFFIENYWIVTATASLQVAAAVALVWFSTVLSRYLARVGGPESVGPQLSLAGGVSAALCLIASGVAQIVNADPFVVQDLAAVQALRLMSFLTGGTLHVAFLGVLIAAAASTLGRTGRIPGWLHWSGTTVAALAIGSPASLVFAPASYLIPAGRFLGFVWLLAMIVATARRGRRAAA